MREEPLLVIFERKPAPTSDTLLKPCGFNSKYAGNIAFFTPFLFFLLPIFFYFLFESYSPVLSYNSNKLKVLSMNYGD